ECREWETQPSGLTDWQQAVSLMHDDLNIELTRDAIAQAVGVHANHLSRLCKKFTGDALASYVTNLRMDRARCFLGDPQYSISEVAALAGYHDETHFRKRFKLITGVTPSAWRKQLV
ncbi:MAG: helix-turn-helix transcriptional regulator, partial [Planctomycetes bacterium]|nr:helix-turn-helix transcriptional regulator [Planctomycetota bacterium]